MGLTCISVPFRDFVGQNGQLVLPDIPNSGVNTAVLYGLFDLISVQPQFRRLTTNQIAYIIPPTAQYPKIRLIICTPALLTLIKEHRSGKKLIKSLGLERQCYSFFSGRPNGFLCVMSKFNLDITINGLKVRQVIGMHNAVTFVCCNYDSGQTITLNLLSPLGFTLNKQKISLPRYTF